MRSEAFLLPNQEQLPDPWLTGKASQGWSDAKEPHGKHTLRYSQHPALPLLTSGRDEDLHGNAERSHSPLGDSGHTDGASGVGGHHGQHGLGAVQPGLGGCNLLERGREENPGLGKAGKPGNLLKTVPLATFGAALLSQPAGSTAPGYLGRRMALCARAGWDRGRS